MKEHERSEGHISFANGFEYFWLTDAHGKKVVVKASIANPLDCVSKQRVGARFEGTESWFTDYGASFLIPSTK